MTELTLAWASILSAHPRPPPWARQLWTAGSTGFLPEAPPSSLGPLLPLYLTLFHPTLGRNLESCPRWQPLALDPERSYQWSDWTQSWSGPSKIFWQKEPTGQAYFPSPWGRSCVLIFLVPPQADAPMSSGLMVGTGVNMWASGCVKAQRKTGFNSAPGNIRDLRLCLTWFMNLTFQVPVQYCCLQHRTLLPSPVTSTTVCCFCFGSVSSFFLELFLHWSLVVFWAPTHLGISFFSILSFCLFILFLTNRWTIESM